MSDDLPPSAGIDRFTIQTTDSVDLQAECSAAVDVSASVVACHPHPLYGGSMHANVIDALFRRLPEHGVSVLRFDFRGAGGSGGTHDNGRAERLDVAAAIDEAVAREPEVPLLLAGYSFGADVALTTVHPAVKAWLAVAPPLAVVGMGEMGALADPRPKHVVLAAHDQFRSPADAKDLLSGNTGVSFTVVDGADHFFAVGLGRIVEVAVAAIDELRGAT